MSKIQTSLRFIKFERKEQWMKESWPTSTYHP
jgi:hypothetical protein